MRIPRVYALRVIVAAMVASVAVAAPTSAATGQPAGAVRGGGITTVRACSAPASPGVASCLALRRTDPAGRPAGIISPLTAPPGYGPADLTAAYHLTAGHSAGATVAIVVAFHDPSASPDLSVYRSQFGLSACTLPNGCLRIVTLCTPMPCTPRSDPGWASEESLDLDMVSAACPACHILVIEANSATFTDLFTAEDKAYASGARYISNSWSGDEYSGEMAADVHFNHPGAAITVASGDFGTGAQYPATSPYVTAVGGTTLTRSGTSWIQDAWSDAGSGCSAYEAKPTWQTVTTGCTRRAESDVSAVADPANGVAVYQTYGGSGWAVYGGTSVSAPIIASVYALAGPPTTGTYPVTYPYLHAAGNLFDVTVGGNGTCGAPMCLAGPGWDGPTGLGSPIGIAAFAP